jgi:uncharacterized protein (TIGR02996 family)
MTDEDALLAAIREYPLEDTPRLAYADWLDEHADPTDAPAPAEEKPKRRRRAKAGAAARTFRAQRAELIRAQVALESLTRADPRFAPLEARAYGLIDAHAKAWYPGGLNLRERTEWDRGFPVPDLPVDATAAQLDAVPLWRLTSHGSAAFFKHKYLHRIGSLLVYNKVPDGTLKRLAARADLRNVTELAFTGQPLEPPELTRVLDAWTDRRLRMFWANSCPVGLGGCNVLAAHPATSNLKLLRVHTAKIGSRGLKVLLESGRFNNLRLATFAHNRTGDAGARHLLNWPALDTIPALYLMNMGFSEKVRDQLRERLGDRGHL